MSNRTLSGERYEGFYGASAAARVGDRIFLSGLTAERSDAASQLRGVFEKARGILSGLGASLADVVRTRIFYTQPLDYAALGKIHGEFFSEPPARPAMSLTQVHFLPSVRQAHDADGAGVMMEVEAARGAASSKKSYAFDMPNADEWGYSGVVQLGGELWVAGVTALQPDGGVYRPGDLGAQSYEITRRIISMVERCGGRATDIVSTRHYTAVAYVGTNTVPHRLLLMHPHHPTSAGITVQGVGPRQAGELIEVEAVIGATESRRNLNTGRPYEEDHHYCRSVRVGDVVYVSGTTSVQLDEQVGSPFDAYGQTIQTLEWIRWGVENQGLSFGNVVRTRSYVVGQENVEHVARGLRDTLGGIKPAATVVGVPALGRPSILVEIEATAVRGAR
ncbi:MAG: hypothetical protein L0177_06095 [Chloroflexi bacterium]|nr:hypothetical protein [Chloroflexota bacterium]